MEPEETTDDDMWPDTTFVPRLTRLGDPFGVLQVPPSHARVQKAALRGVWRAQVAQLFGSFPSWSWPRKGTLPEHFALPPLTFQGT